MDDSVLKASGGPQDGTASPLPMGKRVAALRAVLADDGLDGFILPRADAHQVEALPANAERLAWLTGFTGSMGIAAVLADTAALFVDGRYTLQARSQVDGDTFEMHHVSESPLGAWLTKNLPDGGRIGYDPWLHSAAWVARMREQLGQKDVELAPMAANPIDGLWLDRPPPPSAPALPHDERYAGRSASTKRAEIADDLRSRNIDAAALTSPESIAWLFNIRGDDVPNTPLALSFAVLHSDGTADLFIDQRKVLPETRAHLGNSVRLAPYEGFAAELEELAGSGKTVLLDPATMPEAAISAVTNAGGEPRRGADPCILPRALKNEGEIGGARAAHARDAVAMVRFLHWLDESAGGGAVDELAAEQKLAAFRSEGELHRGPSFDTISGAGPNGAIVHYRVSPETNRVLEQGSFYLVDSGAQYLDGTTDITRTIAIGPISAEMRRHFTLVLKGHIALSEARFPAGTTGSQIDCLARAPLWGAGLDFDHGTGHGIGSYLSVHEGPHRISKIANNVALQPGMILSNEPGYYREGAYGIRIENLLLVDPGGPIEGGERDMQRFEVLTLVPYDRRAIEPGMLTARERAFVDAYHARVFEAVSPLLEDRDREWLAGATAPLDAG